VVPFSGLTSVEKIRQRGAKLQIPSIGPELMPSLIDPDHQKSWSEDLPPGRILIDNFANKFASKCPGGVLFSVAGPIT